MAPRQPVVAIGLDAAEPSLVERWTADGRLPTLARLRARGAYTRLRNVETFIAETPWTTFLGVAAEPAAYMDGRPLLTA